MCVNFSQFLLKNDPARPAPARSARRENEEEKAKFSTAISEKNRFWEFFAKNRRILSQKHQTNRSILCHADLILKFTSKLPDSNRKNIQKLVTLKSVKIWKVLSDRIWVFFDTLSVLNQDGASESPALRGVWVSKSGHFGEASAFILRSTSPCRDLMFVWYSKSQNLVVISALNQKLPPALLDDVDWQVTYNHGWQTGWALSFFIHFYSGTVLEPSRTRSEMPVTLQRFWNGSRTAPERPPLPNPLVAGERQMETEATWSTSSFDCEAPQKSALDSIWLLRPPGFLLPVGPPH